MEQLTDLLKLNYTEFISSFFYKKYLNSCEIEKDEFDEEYFISSLDNGVTVLFNSMKICKVIFLFNSSEDGFFKGSLPLGLTFDMDRQSILNLIGLPTEQKKGGRVKILDEYINWIRYDFNKVSFHLQFNEDDLLIKLSLVSISLNERDI